MRPVKARGGDGLTGREATWSSGEDIRQAEALFGQSDFRTGADSRLHKRAKIRQTAAKVFDSETSPGNFQLLRKAVGLIEIC